MPVTLDMSTAKPIQANPVTLDMSSAQPIGQPKTDEEPGFLDKEIPMDSYTHATERGLQNIGRGIRQGVQGIWSMGKPPENAAEWAATAIAPGIGPAAVRGIKGIIETGKGAVEVPAAIHDINESPDPLGAYGDVAARTSGEGAGQALVALGTEGAAKTVPKIIEGAQNVTPRRAAQIVGGTGGAVAGKGLLSAPGAYYGARLGGRIADAVLGERATQPIFQSRPPAVDVFRDATEQNAPFAGEEQPYNIQDWWKSRGGTLVSERPNGPIMAPRISPPTVPIAEPSPVSPANTSPVTIQSTPKTGIQVPSPSSEAYLNAPVPEGTVVPEGDMTPLLEEMLRRVQAAKQ